MDNFDLKKYLTEGKLLNEDVFSKNPKMFQDRVDKVIHDNINELVIDIERLNKGYSLSDGEIEKLVTNSVKSYFKQ